ncbi:hypothetical protein BLNAU_10043 [Blattamonas nauphoetae]|uniref:Secreted protein n=1 Tax=Blattamonas nauphoetae TaxID=2049346 RepID=A0ABQ9XTV3_9EUKA|nr:hypothetical protein BLNAU_10043 [Blattamonas nauphoetae]
MIKIEVLVIGIISTDCSQFSHSSFQNLHAVCLSQIMNRESADRTAAAVMSEYSFQNECVHFPRRTGCEM